MMPLSKERDRRRKRRERVVQPKLKLSQVGQVEVSNRSQAHVRLDKMAIPKMFDPVSPDVTGRTGILAVQKKMQDYYDSQRKREW